MKTHPLNLIIGCGGSGITTMTALNRLLVQNPDILPRLSDEVYYLAVDTEKDALDKFDQDIASQMGNYAPPFVQRIQLSHNVNILNEIVKPNFVDPFSLSPNDKGLERLRENWWFDQNNNPFTAPKVINLIKGAGQCPPASYGLAWYRLSEIGEIVKRVVDRMVARGNGDPEQLKNMNLIVVAGLSGGTGRGCWSLITFKIREYLLDNYGITVPPVGIFFDATVFDSVARNNQGQRLTLEVNAATGISELSCWMQNGGATGDDRFEYRLPNVASPGRKSTDVLKVDLEINPNSGAPVSSAYLVCGRSKSAILDDNKQYHEMAGAAIYAMIANPEITARSVNDGDPFNSLGASTFEVDALHIHSYFETRARGIALGNLMTNADDVSSDVASFFSEHPFNVVVRAVSDLRSNTEGSLYQRAVAALLAGKTYKSAFSTIVEEMKDWDLSEAEDAVLPLLQPAKDAEVKAAVQQALCGFGKKDDTGTPLGLNGKKGEAAVVAAMKKVYEGTGSQIPSVGRALNFLKDLKAGIEAAQKASPSVLQMQTEAMTKPATPEGAVSTTLKVFSKRTLKEFLSGTGAYNDSEISALVQPSGSESYWGIIPEGVAAANYPKIKEAIAEAFAPVLAKIEKLIRACEQFANCCREARAAFALEEPTAAGGNPGDDAFALLFATPDKIDDTLYDASNRARFYRRILKPIVESRRELEESIGGSIEVGDGMVQFISSVVDNGTLEKLGSDSDRDAAIRKRFLEDLMEATRSNVSLSDNFMLEHFSFEKILEKNREFWNAAIAAAQGSGVRKAELNKKFEKTLGVEPQIDPRNPKAPPTLPEVEKLRKYIAASLASTCAPWWIAEETNAHHSVMMFVPFVNPENSDVESFIEEEAAHTKVQVFDLNDSKGGATPFSYVAFVSEGIMLNETEKKSGKHLLDKIKSLDYYMKPDVNAWLQKAESFEGESIFTTENHNKGIGYLSPIFVNDKKLSSYRWKPWLREDEALAASAENQAIDVMNYALLGTGLTEPQLKSFEEKLAPYGWSLPAIKLQERGQVWLLCRKTLTWDEEEGIAAPNTECPWNKGKKICTSVCNLMTLFEGKGKTGKNGALKQSDVDDGNKLKALLSTEAALFEEHVVAELGADMKKLVKARKDWLVRMRDGADEEDKPVFDKLLKRAVRK